MAYVLRFWWDQSPAGNYYCIDFANPMWQWMELWSDANGIN